jgi:hypothetical protein
MSQLRVLADVDELHIGRVAPGGKVEVTFRGSTTVYRGKISRIAPTVKRMQRIEPDGVRRPTRVSCRLKLNSTTRPACRRSSAARPALPSSDGSNPA